MEWAIREYIFVFATLYSRYESYASLGVFVSAHCRSQDLDFFSKKGVIEIF